MYISNPTRDICKNAAEHGSRVHALPFQPELRESAKAMYHDD